MSQTAMNQRRSVVFRVLVAFALVVLGGAAWIVKRDWDRQRQIELVKVSDEEIAFSKLKPGMAEADARALVGDPSEVQEPPRVKDVFPTGCLAEAKKLLLYQRAPRKSLLILLDGNHRVLCIERAFVVYGKWQV